MASRQPIPAYEQHADPQIPQLGNPISAPNSESTLPSYPTSAEPVSLYPGSTGLAPSPEPQQSPSQPLPSQTGTYRQRSGTTRSRGLTILSPVSATLDTLQTSHPPSESIGRRNRAHTISVSLPSARLRSASSAEPPRSLGLAGRIPSLSSNGEHQQGDLEQGLRLGRRRSSSVARSALGSAGGRRPSTPVGFGIENEDGQLHEDVVGLLDVIDPQVSTVNHLQNMTNSVIFPHFPQLWSRRPEVQLPETSSEESLAPLTGNTEQTGLTSSRPRSATTGRSRAASVSRFLGLKSPSESEATNQDPSAAPSAASWSGAHPLPIPEEPAPASPTTSPSSTSATGTATTIPLTSMPVSRTDSHFSTTPHTHLGTVQELRQEEFDEDLQDIKADHELDRHVKHVLSQNKRVQAKKILRGVWDFVKTPMGAFTAIYGFCVAFWGAAIVLFLLGWIPTSSKYRQDVWVEISSQVTNGLFTLTGVGLIPWRAVDTYRMSVIWTLRKKNERLRKQRGLPPIEDPNDLPDPRLIKDYVHVLSEKDQERLHYQQDKFAQSQTWYRPHATATHRAFPMSWALWNTILMDGNSLFQCMLCSCMWSMSWHVRPAWTTGCLIPCSFLCGIGAAVLIWQGSVRTKKHDTVSAKLREALGVPLAIAVPHSADGTVPTSAANGAPATDVPLEKTGAVSPKEQGKGEVGRRTTVTFGDVHDHMGFDGEGKRGEGEKGRDRGATVAAPERRTEDGAGVDQEV